MFFFSPKKKKGFLTEVIIRVQVQNADSNMRTAYLCGVVFGKETYQSLL